MTDTTAEDTVKRQRVARAEFDTFEDGEDVDSLPKSTRDSVSRDKSAALLAAVEKSKSGSVSNGTIYPTKDDAERVGKAFQRVLNDGLEDVEVTLPDGKMGTRADGESARLAIIPKGDGFKFNVYIGPAREGKGTPRGPRDKSKANGPVVQVQAPSPENAAKMAAEDAAKVKAPTK